MGFQNPIAMADGKPFFGAKAYKDAKVCNMMTVSELHRRYHEDTGIIFSSMYPGCIAETALFREKRPWFRKAFPWFMKYVTGGYVGETEAGESPRVLADPVEKFLRTNKVLLFKILKCRKEFGEQVLRLLDLHQMMFDGRTIIAKTVKNLLSITFLFL